MKDALYQLTVDTLRALQARGELPAGELPDFALERTRDEAHGDFACNAAMALAKAARKPPRVLAQAIVDALPHNPMIERVEIAGPGFINFFLGAPAWHAEVARILEQGARYGHNTRGGGHTVGVEFVSANPTGPLHVGHGRGAALGDSIARLLTASGWQVKREYYYNDADVQIANLARSAQARARGLTLDDAGWPEDGYRGEYIARDATGSPWFATD